MRYELSDHERNVIDPMLPNKPRGISRVDDRRVLNGLFLVVPLWRTGGNNRCSGPPRGGEHHQFG
jgi:hypothetical protein